MLLWLALRRLVNLLLGTLRRLYAFGLGSARLMLRQRRAVAGTAELTRLFDVHAVVVAADCALLAGLLLAPGAPSRAGQLAAVAAALLLSVPAALLRFRSAAGILCALRGIGAVLAAQWVPGWGLLLALAATALPQWTLHLGLLARMQRGNPGGRLPVLFRAIAYGLVAGAFAGAGALLAGWADPSRPLWLAAALLTLATLLALRVPNAGGPRRQRPVAVPKQGKAPPEGYAVYRPTSFDTSQE